MAEYIVLFKRRIPGVWWQSEQGHPGFQYSLMHQYPTKKQALEDYRLKHGNDRAFEFVRVIQVKQDEGVYY